MGVISGLARRSALGHNRSAEVAYLISGGDDLTEAVTDAQDLGLHVKLLKIPAGDSRPHAVAANLSLSVDGMVPIPTDALDQLVTRAVRPGMTTGCSGDISRRAPTCGFTPPKCESPNYLG